MTILYYTIKTLGDLLVLLVIISVILSYVMDPYHPVRRWVEAIVEPMLTPIRRVVPLVGMLDFSPIVLIILIRIVFNLILNLLR
jgi:YggT family protein